MNRTKEERISDDRERLENPYAHLQPDGTYAAITELPEVSRAANISISPDSVRGFPAKKRAGDEDFAYSLAEIERATRRLQTAIWELRDSLWPGGAPQNPASLLDPAVALQLLGFDYQQADTLGEFRDGGNRNEVAGAIDSDAKTVRVSRRFPPHIRTFTTAHELGHAVLHPAQGLHRDRPLDGTMPTTPRNAIETEADQFATCFLMPGKLVATRFEEQFLTRRFTPTSERSYALGQGSSLKEKCKRLRDLSTILAKAEYYNGKNVSSLAEQFHVSVEAMAIRLEELELVKL